MSLHKRKIILFGAVIGLTIFSLVGYCCFSDKKQIIELPIDRNKLIQLFDELDSKVNKGKGYSEYLNTKGFPTGALLAWSESYLMQGYANMYRATGNIKYLDKLHNHIQSVLSSRDDKIGKRNYKNELSPTWGTDRYTKNNEWMNFLVHTGQITYPILDFLLLIKDSNIEKYSTETDDILREVEKSVKYHDEQWKGNHYLYPKDFYPKDWILPINQQSALGASLIALYKITGKKEYLEKAESLAKFIKDTSVQKHDAGGYVLKDIFKPGKKNPESKIIDISHATLNIRFAYLAYKNGIVFDRTDMEKFTMTIKKLAVDNNNHFPLFLDGRGGFDYEIVAGQYAFLAEFDEDIYDSLMYLFFNHLSIHQTAKYMQEDWWGTVMLGLSRMALYQTELELN